MVGNVGTMGPFQSCCPRGSFEGVLLFTVPRLAGHKLVSADSVYTFQLGGEASASATTDLGGRW